MKKQVTDFLQTAATTAYLFLGIRIIERAINIPPRNERKDRIWQGSGYYPVRRGDGLREVKQVLEFFSS